MPKHLSFFLLLVCLFWGHPLAWSQSEADTYDSKFPENFTEKYADKEFIYEAKIENTGAWERFKLWLEYKIKELFNLNSAEASKAIDWIINIFAIIIIILVIYFIVKAIMNKEGTWIFGASSDKKIIDYETVAQNIHKADFDKMIREAISAEEYRLAIRWYYLWLLKQMSDKSIIEWDPDKTNADYLYEIKQPPLQSQFAYVSYLYNYTWYGHFDIDKESFDKSKTAYEKIFRSLK
ncbi:MAG: DUF4129 domain-containing protein [Flavobacterium sp.]